MNLMLDVSTIHTGPDFATNKKISFNDKNIVTPTFFASITSAASRAQTTFLLETFLEHEYTKLLISSYDIYHSGEKNRKDIFDVLNNYVKQQKFLLLDSGFFEDNVFRRDDWNFELYKEIIEQTSSDIFTSFDVSKSDLEVDELIKNTIEKTKNSFNLINGNHCVVACHGNGVDDICDIIDNLANENKEFVKMIAIPERELGNDIKELYFSTKKIRNTLNNYDQNSILHVLGCGDPISISVLSYAGADSFDAVDWNRWMIDIETLSWSNLNLLPLLNCVCDSCKEGKTKTAAKAYWHNLTFYNNYLTRLQDAIHDDVGLIDFLKQWSVDQERLTTLENFFYT